MVFKTTAKTGLNRSGFKRKDPETSSSFKASSGFKTKTPPSNDLSLNDARKLQKKALERATLRALEKAHKEAVKSGVELSPWENEFISDVRMRVKTYGRAFSDPEKGANGTTLSLLQGLKLKEITKKAKDGKR